MVLGGSPSRCVGVSTRLVRLQTKVLRSTKAKSSLKVLKSTTRATVRAPLAMIMRQIADGAGEDMSTHRSRVMSVSGPCAPLLGVCGSD